MQCTQFPTHRAEKDTEMFQVALFQRSVHWVLANVVSMILLIGVSSSPECLCGAAYDVLLYQVPRALGNVTKSSFLI